MNVNGLELGQKLAAQVRKGCPECKAEGGKHRQGCLVPFRPYLSAIDTALRNWRTVGPADDMLGGMLDELADESQEGRAGRSAEARAKAHGARSPAVARALAD